MTIITLQGAAERQRNIHYEVDATQPPIGQGGMGRVYKGLCVDDTTGSTRPVAIKFVYDDMPEKALERARREAAIQLRNDNLVEMLGFIETEEKDQFGMVRRRYHVVSELLTGVSLSSLLEGKTKDRDDNDVPFAVKMLQDYRNDPEHFARIIVTGVLSGLMALHDAGYIHRDIDPSNIMLTTEGHVKLIDFGICKQIGDLTAGDRGLTETGTFLGKPEYAAPELAIGDLQHQNQTTDIYAMGILLYQCIVGHTPFEGDRTNVLNNQIKTKMPLSLIKNRGLRSIIATACAKRQDQRYQTAAQMRVALETFSGRKRSMSNNLKIGIVAGIVTVIIAIIAILFLVQHNRKVAAQKTFEVEQALLQQQKAEQEANIKSALERGRSAIAKGRDSDIDGFEQQLMEGYTAFAEALSLAEGTVFAEQCATEVKQASELITNAYNLLITQSIEAENLSDTVGCDIYRTRAHSLQRFMEKAGIETPHQFRNSTITIEQ